MNCRTITVSLLLLIFSAAIAYAADCLEANHHHEYFVEDESAEIHCPPSALHSDIQTVSKFQSRKHSPSKVPPIIDPKIDRIPLYARLHDHPFWERLSQQNLFRLEQVFRL